MNLSDKWNVAEQNDTYEGFIVIPIFIYLFIVLFFRLNMRRK